ncbi:MAG: thermostable hemolysin [Candidatus Fonsibacter sp.]|jgi:hypothetical protein
MQFKIINQFHPLRVKAENFIIEKYRKNFSANIKKFPNILLALINREEEIVACCGIRTEKDGLFSQVYLKENIRKIIQRIKSSKENFKIFEIVNLTTSNPIASIKFVKELHRYMFDHQVKYVIFSGTMILRNFLLMMGLKLTVLAKAEINNISNPEDWGRYYDSDPHVCLAETPAVQFSILFKKFKEQLEYVNISSIAQ